MEKPPGKDVTAHVTATLRRQHPDRTTQQPPALCQTLWKTYPIVRQKSVVSVLSVLLATLGGYSSVLLHLFLHYNPTQKLLQTFSFSSTSTPIKYYYAIFAYLLWPFGEPKTIVIPKVGFVLGFCVCLPLKETISIPLGAISSSLECMVQMQMARVQEG